MKHFLFLLFCYLLCFPGFAEHAKFLRYPALSPDGTQITFSFAGDLFCVPSTGGIANRLTFHPAYDGVSLWSPNGKYIVFESNRNGNIDLFRLNLKNGAVLQLTFCEKDEKICDFTPNGKKILFQAIYDQPFPHRSMLYEIPLKGGTPQLVLNDFSTYGSYTPSKSLLFYTRGEVDWWRQEYRGSGNEDIYSFNPKTGKYQKWTLHLGQDRFPMPISATHLFYLTDEKKSFFGTKSGVFNLYEWKGKKRNKVTFHENDSVQFPRMNAKKTHIVYRCGLDLFLFTRATKISKRIEISTFLGERVPDWQEEQVTGGVDDYDLTQDGQHVLINTRGTLFGFYRDTLAPKRFAAQTLVRKTAREGNPILYNRGLKAFFVSQDSGKKQIYHLRSKELDLPLSVSKKREQKRASKSKKEEFKLKLSPNEKKLAFVRGTGELVVRHLATKKEKVLLRHWSAPKSFCWSPDSQWLAYEVEDSNLNSDIFLISANGGIPFNVSNHPDDDYSPAWSPDGTRLSFVSRRQGSSQDLYVVVLDKAFFESTEREDLLYSIKEYYKKIRLGIGKKRKASTSNQNKQTTNEKPAHQHHQRGWNDPKMEPSSHQNEWQRFIFPKKRAPKQSENSTQEKKEDVEFTWVRIDFEDLANRIVRVTYSSRDENSPLWDPLSQGLFFTASSQYPQKSKVGTDLFYLSLMDFRVRQITKGGVNPSKIKIRGNKLFFLSRGSLYQIRLSLNQKEQLQFSSWQKILFEGKRRYRQSELRQQTFVESWKMVKDHFYDPTFHGKSWFAAGVKYLYWVKFARHPQDFSDIIAQALGSLNASHLYHTLRKRNKVRTGFLGIQYLHVPEGLQIIEATPGGPCDLEKSRVILGEILVAIDGVSLKKRRNLYQLLTNKVDQEITLTLSNDGILRDLVVRPISWERFYQLDYQEYCQKKKELVEQYSRRELAYIHLSKMTPASFETFEQELFQQSRKAKGLILDIRNNGGGWYADYFLMALLMPQHGYVIPRNGASGYPHQRRPFYGWNKPLVVICNEYTFSNAEIFAHGIKRLKRGALVGLPTPGKVASARNFILLDGSQLQIPSLGWYLPGSSLSMELNGATPDHIVKEKPGEFREGEDSQLLKAVQVLLAKIKK